MTMGQFETEFQAFMRGAYTATLVEDWERHYAQDPKHIPKKCPHGKTELTCHECYFKNN